ncbi:MAG: type I methionyl aminopeptidase [Planctomycetaceae bacterium]
MITLKSRREIDRMRAAGAVVAEAHQLARAMIAPGITTAEIDAAVEALMAERGVIPLLKGFPGEVPFPAVTCMSVNHEIVHGIPSSYCLQAGDIVSVDTGCKLDGWCADAAWSYPVGEVDDEKRRLLQAGERILAVAIEAFGTERKWSGVVRRMMQVARGAGFSLVEQFVGHGIGREMHEPPQVPNHLTSLTRREDFEIRTGLVLAIEPMVNAGSPDVRILADHWTAVTTDGRPAVHFEHTVALTPNGPELLTEGVGK